MRRSNKLEAYPGRDDSGAIYDVKGRGGALRHRGYFSDQNPYRDDIANATNNKDIDASYERAVEWEADWANLQEQREYDRAVLEEQRDYDSPLAQLQRDKAAGINSELSGGSSGGGTGAGSAQLAQREIDDQRAHSNFKNAYDDKAQRMEGWNTASNFISSVANAFSSIVSGISTIKQLPGQLKLLDAQSQNQTASANLYNSQAGEINALLAGKKQYQTITNGGAVLSSLLGNFDKISGETDITPYLNVLGVPEGEHGAYKQFIKELVDDPRQLASLRKGQFEATKQAVDNAIYTQGYLLRVGTKSAELAELKLDTDIIRQGMQYSFEQLLAESNYVQDSASLEALSASNRYENQKLIKQSLQRQAYSYGKILQNYKDQLFLAQSRRVDLVNLEQKNGFLTDDERAELDYLNIAIPAINSLGMEEFSQMNSIVARMQRNNYITRVANGENLNGDGYILQRLSLNWGDFVNGAKTGNDIAREWVNTGINAIGAVGGLALGVGVITKPNPTGQTITNYGVGSDGAMQPIGMTQKTYNYNLEP